MVPAIKGPTPWAVILCNFNDVPLPETPKSEFLRFISEYGRGGLFDYWRDISNGVISLAGSEVFGWFTMQYSFFHDSKDPFRNSGRTFPRLAWILEAKRLAALNGIDLSKFHSVIAVVNAAVDDSNIGNDTAMAIGGCGQHNWWWCSKCQGLVFGEPGSPGACPAGESHDLTNSAHYALPLNNPLATGENNWRHCRKCHGLAYNGDASPGACPAGDLHDLSHSGDYTLGFGDVGFPGQNLWKRCRKCLGLGYSGNASPGACPTGGLHDYAESADYTLGIARPEICVTFNAHETGHCYGLQHSWSANPDIEYGDPWDIMSAMRVRTFDNHHYPPAGPGINAPTLYKLGWLPEERVFTYVAHPGETPPINDGVTIELTSLNRPDLEGYQMVRILSPNHIYTVEFRQASGWDSGIGAGGNNIRDGVLIHELRSNYSIGQNNWKWCSKCQGLHYSGGAICSAGGIHDHSDSFNYKLVMDDPGFPGQHSWHWCSKCQQLVNGNGASAPCSAGGMHDLTHSADYALSLNNEEFAGQQLWKWCNKCQCLIYSNNASKGACSIGGVHDFSGSGNYTLTHDDNSSPGQDQWRWCRKCQGLAFDGYSSCPAGGAHNHSGADYSIQLDSTSFSGQNLWKQCGKCQGLYFSGNDSPGACPAGGMHDGTDSGDYTLLQGAGDAIGQNHWKWCSKCQGLVFTDNPPGPCPGGGNHDTSGSLDYTLSNFGQDKTYLIQSDFQPGQIYLDAAKGVKVEVVSFDSTIPKAVIKIGFSFAVIVGPFG
jgi:hypothetical protein